MCLQGQYFFSLTRSNRLILRQRFFAAWRQETDRERYEALKTVHNMTLQRLLHQNKDANLETSFDPMVAPQIKQALLDWGCQDTGHKTVTPYPSSGWRNGLAELDSKSNASRPNAYRSGSSSDDGDGTPVEDSAVLHHQGSPYTQKDSIGPRINHRSTARVLHTQLATAQLARMFHTIVESRHYDERVPRRHGGVQSPGALHISSKPSLKR